MGTKRVELITCTVCQLPTHPTRMATDEIFVEAHPAFAATAPAGSCSDCALHLPKGWRPL